jgi:alkylmercury lyase
MLRWFCKFRHYQESKAVDDGSELARQLSLLSSARDNLSSFMVPLLRLLAKGEPVSIEQLAATTGQPELEVRKALATLPDAEYDEEGCIVGFGLTLRPTPHCINFNGRQLYTWCALDTLIFPAMLGCQAHIESSCKASGAPVRVVVDAGRLINVEPPTAVVSIVTPEPGRSIRAAFCQLVHFFVSREAAGPWRGENQKAVLVPVAEAHRFGLFLAKELLSKGLPGLAGSSCC